MQCATHPDVETDLRCGKCDTPICPRCLVQTPVGARCKSCANLRRPPMYQVSAPVMARAAGVSLAIGAATGAAWGFLLPNSLGIGILGIFIALFIGSPIGYGFANLLDKVTNRKRGPVMQGIAVAGIVGAWLVHVAVGAEIRGDIFGLALVAAACAGAISRLR
ncbi:MAG: hypothetical protein HYX51_01395 [Chloroflexi bacterium]|nr:hypothetical protein [Chloroflexota bacterium]